MLVTKCNSNKGFSGKTSVLLHKTLVLVDMKVAHNPFYRYTHPLEEQGIDVKFIAREYSDKCHNKGLDPSFFFTKLQQRIPQYKARWKSSLQEQIKDLPDFELVDREVQRKLKKIKQK